MRPGCFCLRPSFRSSTSPQAHGEPEDLRGGSETVGAASEPEVVQRPVRAVSPGDVRRTASGRVFKTRNDVGLQTLQQGSTFMRVLGGSELKAYNAADSSGCESSRTLDKLQQSVPKRILQPVISSTAANKPRARKSLLHLLQSAKLDTDKCNAAPVARSVRCKSILEASEMRLQQHKMAAAACTGTTQSAVVQAFANAYLSAVSTGNQQWASAAGIAAMFSADAVLKTQDKQTFYGRPAVLRRLNSGTQQLSTKQECRNKQLLRLCHIKDSLAQLRAATVCAKSHHPADAGVGLLLKVLSSSSSTIPKPAVSGPLRVDDTTWLMTYTFKKGVVKYAIQSRYTFMKDKIVMIESTRS